MSTNSIFVQGDREGGGADPFKPPAGPLESVQLYMRHPHFDVDSLVELDEVEESPEIHLPHVRNRRSPSILS